MPKIQKLPVLKVSSTTWARDSHDLFDYEARHVNTKTFYIQQPMKCFRSGQEVQLVAENQPHPQNADYLVKLMANRDGKFLVSPADRTHGPNGVVQSPKKLWMIVKDLSTHGHVLSEGDVIKLGRFKLRVKQMVTSSDQTVVPELKLDDAEPATYNHPLEEMATKQCRICLLDGPAEDDDLLISPCSCKGSIEYVHVGCLRHWVSGRLNLANQGGEQGGAFFYRQLQCELCKTCFPQTIVLNGNRIQIVEVPPTPAPFIVVECLQNSNRGLHVVSMAERKTLKLGRGHESDVRIADVSISRYHATIRFNNGNFVLEDNNSKFGTLVAIRRPQIVDINSPLSVQVGRTVVTLGVEQHPSAEIQTQLQEVGSIQHSSSTQNMDTDGCSPSGQQSLTSSQAGVPGTATAPIGDNAFQQAPQGAAPALPNANANAPPAGPLSYFPIPGLSGMWTLTGLYPQAMINQQQQQNANAQQPGSGPSRPAQAMPSALILQQAAQQGQQLTPEELRMAAAAAQAQMHQQPGSPGSQQQQGQIHLAFAYGTVPGAPGAQHPGGPGQPPMASNVVTHLIARARMNSAGEGAGAEGAGAGAPANANANDAPPPSSSVTADPMQMQAQMQQGQQPMDTNTEGAPPPGAPRRWPSDLSDD